MSIEGAGGAEGARRPHSDKLRSLRIVDFEQGAQRRPMNRTAAYPAISFGKSARLLLLCGIAAAGVYVGTDIIAAMMYPDFSYRDQAVSELFAIGAPTSNFVVVFFSVSSALLLLFSVGIAVKFERYRSLRLLSIMFAGSALDALLLWNFFPMHMRGAERGLTDTMHLVLATNPFVLATLIISIFAFRGSFRWVSAAALAVIVVLAAFGFHYAPALDSGLPTPWLGMTERLGQYLYQSWQVGLSVLLLRTAKLSAPI
jgi:uncharacterized protein DUF998